MGKTYRRKIHHTKKGWAADKRKRSRQDWERGRGAKRKGNPNYKPVRRKGRKVYVLRKRR